MRARRNVQHDATALAPAVETEPVSQAGPRSVGRIVDTLALLVRVPAGLSLSELARRLQVPKASLADLLAGLASSGFLEKDATGRYRLGPGALDFARRAISSRSLTDFTHEHLVTLVGLARETALVARLDDSTMTSVYVDKVESEEPVRYTVPLGLRRELHATAAGKVLLAHLPVPDRDAFIRKAELESFTSNTVTDAGKLRLSLEQVVAQGYSVTIDERTIGASAVAAPIFDGDSNVLGALVVAGSTERIVNARERLIELVRKTARQISLAFPSHGGSRLDVRSDPASLP